MRSGTTGLYAAENAGSKQRIRVIPELAVCLRVRSGSEVEWWAHNPQVAGSKPASENSFCSLGPPITHTCICSSACSCISAGILNCLAQQHRLFRTTYTTQHLKAFHDSIGHKRRHTVCVTQLLPSHTNPVKHLPVVPDWDQGVGCNCARRGNSRHSNAWECGVPAHQQPCTSCKMPPRSGSRCERPGAEAGCLHLCRA